jgi:tRNA threonylcarbamoyladenosine biosynthesis protein TsaB
MTLFIAVHTRYSDVQLGLFKNNLLIHRAQESSKKVSHTILFMIQELLTQQALELHDLDFIAANQGPAPFTTLRVALSSVNGLAFATHLPLIGVNCLYTFLQETANTYTGTGTIIVLLNAFCQDVYYGILDADKKISIGVSSIHTLLDKLALEPGSLYLVGNGVDLYRSLICEKLGAKAIIPTELPLNTSLEAIGYQALNKWHTQQDREKQLMPCYIKSSLIYQS